MINAKQLLRAEEPLNGMHIFLSIDEDAQPDQVIATLGIAKPLDFPPIRDDTIAVILLDYTNSVLRPTGWPSPGWLPEARLRGATASAEYAFARGNGVERAIVVL